MYSVKQKLNTVGIISGMFLLIIPFYYYIRTFISLSTIKRNNGPFALVLTTTIVRMVSILIMLFSAISLIITFTNTSYYYGYSTPSISEVVAPFIILILVGIIMLVLFIVTGISMKNYLESDRSESLTNDERFELAKVAGINLANIPLYIIIKTIMGTELIKSIDDTTGNVVIAFFIVYGVSIFLSWIPFIGFLFAIAYIVLYIILAVKLNGLFTPIIMTDEHETDEYSSFSSF